MGIGLLHTADVVRPKTFGCNKLLIIELRMWKKKQS